MGTHTHTRTRLCTWKSWFNTCGSAVIIFSLIKVLKTIIPTRGDPMKDKFQKNYSWTEYINGQVLQEAVTGKFCWLRRLIISYEIVGWEEERLLLPSSTPWSLALMSTYLHFLGVETGLSFHYPPVWAPPNGKSLYNLSERERSEQTEVHGGGGWWWGGGQLKLLLCRCHWRRSSRFTASPMSVTGGCRVSLDGRCISPLLFSIFWIDIVINHSDTYIAYFEQ